MISQKSLLSSASSTFIVDLFKMIPPICNMMNVYAELPCFCVDYSIEKCSLQAPFVRQKIPEKPLKINGFPIFLRREEEGVIRRRILNVENTYFAGKLRKRRTKNCVFLQRKSLLDCPTGGKIIYLLFFRRFYQSGLQILPDPVLRHGCVHPSQGSG